MEYQPTTKPKEVVFDEFLKIAAKFGYNYNKFKEICQEEHKIGTDCLEIWNSLIKTSKFLMISKNRSPADGVMWFIETAFPTASVLRTIGFKMQVPFLPLPLREKIMRETGHKARIKEEERKDELYNRLLEEELGLIAEIKE